MCTIRYSYYSCFLYCMYDNYKKQELTSVVSSQMYCINNRVDENLADDRLFIDGYTNGQSINQLLIVIRYVIPLVYHPLEFD